MSFRKIFIIAVNITIITSCTTSFHSPMSIEEREKLSSSVETYIISKLQSDGVSDKKSCIGPFNFNESPKELIKVLQKSHISDTFQPSIAVESSIVIDGNHYSPLISYYFSPKDTLSLVLMYYNEYETPSLIHDVSRILGNDCFKILPGKENKTLKIVWIHKGLVYTLKSIDTHEDFHHDNKVVLAIYNPSEPSVSKECSMSDVDALIYAFSNKGTTVEALEDFWHSLYDGSIVKYDRGQNHFTWPVNIAKDSLYYYHSVSQITITDVISSYITPLGYKADLNNFYKELEKKSTETDRYRSIQREKAMRDAGLDNMADKERKERWNKYK